MSIEDQIRTAMRPYRSNTTLLPTGPAPDGSSRTAARRKNARRRRSLVVLLTAAGLVIGTTVAIAGVGALGDQTPPSLQRAIDDLFGGGQCVTGGQATASINQSLASLGETDWQVVSRPGATTDHCVAAGFVPSLKQVVLVPVSGPSISDALEGVATTMLNRCFDQEAATDFMTTTLSGLGQSDFTISSTGPFAIPAGQEQAVQTHVAAGCYVYSGMGWDSDGRATYFIHGPDE